METIIYILTFLFFACLFCGFFFSTSLIFWVSKQKCGLPFRYSADPGKALSHYIQWCKEHNIERNENPINKHRAAIKLFLASLALLMLILVLVSDTKNDQMEEPNQSFQPTANAAG